MQQVGPPIDVNCPWCWSAGAKDGPRLPPRDAGDQILSVLTWSRSGGPTGRAADSLCHVEQPVVADRRRGLCARCGFAEVLLEAEFADYCRRIRRMVKSIRRARKADPGNWAAPICDYREGVQTDRWREFGGGPLPPLA